MEKIFTSIAITLFGILMVPMSVFATQSGGGYIVHDQINSSPSINSGGGFTNKSGGSFVSSQNMLGGGFISFGGAYRNSAVVPASPPPAAPPSGGGGSGGGGAQIILPVVNVNSPVVGFPLAGTNPIAIDVGCLPGNKFSVTTGNMCDSGCFLPNKFSVTTGRLCASFMPGVSAPAPPASLFIQQVKTIAVNLWKGVSGVNVAILQQFLISQGKGPSAQALAKVGATSYFGVLTRAALAEFQLIAGINPALGYFGLITRAYIRAHY